MYGRDLFPIVRSAIGGVNTADIRLVYDKLDAAVTDFVRQTRLLFTTVDIETVADQQAYNLPNDFIELFVRTRNSSKLVAKYETSGGSISWPRCVSFDSVFLENLSDAKETPSSFCITDVIVPSDILGSSFFINSVAEGESSVFPCAILLTDSTQEFTATVNVRDSVVNATDGSSGMVLEVCDDTTLWISLFPGDDDTLANDCDINIGDECMIMQASRKQIKLDAPSENSGDIITIPYICKPPPVYVDLNHWPFQAESCQAICAEAAYLFLLSSGAYDHNAHGHLHGLFVEEIRKIKTKQGREKLQSPRRHW